MQLQDYSKSPLGEMEVKFQLTRDTLEAMLRSMTYISEQLSSMVSLFCILELKSQLDHIDTWKDFIAEIGTIGNNLDLRTSSYVL